MSNVDKKSVHEQPVVRLCNYTDVYYRNTIAPDQVFMEATATREQTEAFRLLPGDVIITKDSETPEDIGVPAFVADAAPDVVCGYHLALLRPRPERVDPRFLYWSMCSRAVRAQLTIAATGVTRFGLRSDAIKDARINLPPLNQQRSSVELLDKETARLDALLYRKQRLLALLEEERGAVARAAASGELSDGGQGRRESDVTWLHTLPSHWRIAKVSLVAKLGTGHTPSRSEAQYWEAGRDIPWLTTSDIERFRDDRCDVLTETKESISRAGLENSSAVLHPAGTVALSRTASVGFSVIMGRDMATSQDFVTWTCSPLLDPRFLLLCLRAMRRDLVGRLAMGSTHKTIYMPDIQGLRIPLPPIDEQIRAVEVAGDRLRKIDELSTLVQRQLPLLKEHREALITAFVTGQPDPIAHRASALTT